MMNALRLHYYTLLGILIYIRITTITGLTNSDPEQDDVPSRTIRAGIVFEGRAHREPRIPHSPGLYTVRFKVIQVYKGRFPVSERGSDPHPEVVSVGVFGRPDSARNCSQVAPRVTMESRYIVFLTDDVANGNDARFNMSSSSVAKARTESFYRISGCPEPVTKEVSRQVRKHSCTTCGQKARVRRISGGKEVFSGQKILIHCRSSGKPRPRITWYKDGAKLTQNDRISFTQQRQSSQLRIQRTKQSDSGLYQCQAANALGQTDKIGTTVVVHPESEKPHSEPCPRQDYCLNGGVCYVMPLLKKNFCECAKSYVGLRCEEKFTNQNIQVVLGKEVKRKRSSSKRRRF